jgi:extracellular elastinolytic metalloproteinase
MLRPLHSIFLLLVSITINFGQASSAFDHFQLAKKHISENAEKWNLTKSDYKDLLVSSSATSDKGITYMYIMQTLDNVEIQNAIMTMVIDKNGKVVSDKHTFVKNASKKVSSNKSTIKADKAIIAAAEHLGVKLTNAPILIAGKNIDNTIKYAQPELAKSQISAKQKYVKVGEKLVLSWSLKIDMRSSSDYWDLSIDANTGNFVSKYNMTVYCKHHKDAYARHDDCQLKDVQNMDGSQQRLNQFLSANTAAASYRVFKLPAESPNHGGRSIATDADFPQASPFGWHDTNGSSGPEYTTTRGNNVHAYQDKDDDDDPDGTTPNGGQALSFDFSFDNNKDPRESSDAAVTNLFYMVNMMHDVTSVLGFNEEFGNFQDKNYSGNSADGQGDFVLAQAFDGIELFEAGTDMSKVNNANFSTPDDGFNGRMQMFLWQNSGGAISIDEPIQLAGFVSTYGTSTFGSSIPSETDPAIIGNIAIARDNTSNPFQGCQAFSNPNEINGKIALVERGLCEFGRKVLNAEEAGAIACIICNVSGVSGGNGEEVLSMGPGAVGAQVKIPSIFMRKSDCDKIKTTLSNDVPVIMTWKSRERVGSEYLDGSLDNGIIAHEFGHGISNRLTGGRLSSGCLSNDEQMGEGWSDYFSLIMTHEPGDKGTDPRGIGTFADAQTKDGGGIRRYPYSTDMRVNPQTFDNIKGTSAPHPLGEVWTDMLWDMYWKMIEKYGYDADWTNVNSGNHKAAFLVMEGMKIQPCNPGFIDGRDAIFAADDIHYNGENECLLWEVFARRGLGFNADGGLSSDRNDGKEGFEALPTCIEKLKITKDVNPQVDPGGDINVKLVATNHVRTPLTGIVVTDEIPTGATFVSGSASINPTINGNILTFNIGNLEYDKPLEITYKLKAGTNNKSVTLLYDGFDIDILWDIQKNEGNEDWLPVSDIFRSEFFSFRIPNVEGDVDALLISPEYTVTGANPVLRFYHRFDTEASADGGFVEVSVDGGAFKLITKDKFLRNQYNGPIAYSTIAIPALEGFSGSTNNQWIDSYINLSEYSGKKVQFRYRFVSDAMAASTADFNGWIIDDVSLVDVFTYSSKACIAANNGTSNQACTDEVKTYVNSSLESNTDDESYFDVNVSPNPTNDNIILDVSAPVSSLAKLQIIAVDGRVIRSMPIPVHNDRNQYKIDVQDLSQGIYILKLESGKRIFTTKLVKK